MAESTSLTLIDQIKDVERKASDLLVCNQDSYTVAGESIALLKRLFDMAEGERTARKRPHLDAAALIDAEFKPLTNKITNLKGILEQKMGEYQHTLRVAEQARKAEEERLRREAAAEEARKRAEYEENLRKAAEQAARMNKAIELPPAPPPPPPAPIAIPPAPTVAKTTQTTMGSVSSVEVWTYEVMDSSMVPREYLTPDLAKITKVVKAGVREIPGVRIFAKYSSSVKGG